MNEILNITIKDNININNCRRYYIEIIVKNNDKSVYRRLANNYNKDTLELFLIEYTTADLPLAPYAILKHDELYIYDKLKMIIKDLPFVSLNLRELPLIDPIHNTDVLQSDRFSALYDKRTNTYYSIEDRYIHHLLIRYIALNYLIEQNIVNESNYNELSDCTLNNNNQYQDLYAFEDYLYYEKNIKDNIHSWDDFKEFAMRPYFNNYGYISIPEKYFDLIDDYIDKNLEFFGSSENKCFYKQLLPKK